MLPAIIDSLPNVYHSIAPKILQSGLPEEAFATCANCAMTRDLSAGRDRTQSFSPDLKCCTFFPDLPNYLVGSALSDESGVEGVLRLKKAIRARVGVTPKGISPPRTYSLVFERSKKLGFGNSRSMLCPYYIKEIGGCSIWRHRNAMCSTYFCKYVGADRGTKFWLELRNYLEHIQTQLSTFAIFTLMGKAAIVLDILQRKSLSEMSPSEVDGYVEEEEYKALWMEFEGNESGYYQQCFEVVKALDQETFQNVCGVNERLNLQLLTRRYTEMMAVPTRLRLSSIIAMRLEEGASYSVFLPHANISISVLRPVLDAFEAGAEVTAVVQSLKETHSIQLEFDYLWMLFRHKVLIEDFSFHGEKSDGN